MSEVQLSAGNQNVQLQYVYGSTISVTFNGASRLVPLEPAKLPLPNDPEVVSATMMVRARHGAVPFAD